MNHKPIKPTLSFFAILTLTAFACNLLNRPLATEPPPIPSPTATTIVEVVEPTATLFTSESNLPTLSVPTNTPEIIHSLTPPSSQEFDVLIHDVESVDTAPEKRAPYGDSYDINRLERPFEQDMTYIPDVDIATYDVSDDGTWLYVSIDLIGEDPNNPLGINYGVELDHDADGFGDTIIWAKPPYAEDWSTDGVQVFEDTNHDTGGLSAELSDAPFDGDGYDTQIFDSGVGEDPDLAWVRADASTPASVQFAFKRSLTDKDFMLGVLADAGLKDVGQLDYVDRFLEEEAGSPEKSEKYYPLKALYAVDNVCREAFGFVPTGFEPQLCPRDTKETGRPGGGCQSPGQYTHQSGCEAAGCAWRQNPNSITAVTFHCTFP